MFLQLYGKFHQSQVNWLIEPKASIAIGKIVTACTFGSITHYHYGSKDHDGKTPNLKIHAGSG